MSPDGAHLRLDGRPFHVRGVTYGSFLPRSDGRPFPHPARIDADFAAMARAGFNTVRVYAAPPIEMLDVAAAHGLRLVVGLDYPDWRSLGGVGRRMNQRVLDAGRRALADVMELCAGRDEILAISVGNEVPGDLVRLHGAGAVEQTLAALVREAHQADPQILATYMNYPTTEYLSVEGQDIACFNVFLETPDSFRRYLRHLQVISGDIPVVVSELGLASGVHGEAAQAHALEWQLEAVDESGCAGAIVFSWTDEWGVAGEPVTGWGFGITDSDRRPKAAIEVTRKWGRRTLRDLRAWPRVSVIVCAYNEARTISDCLASLRACDYPDLEVIVCDDGSTDETLEIARRFPFRVVPLPHRGLGAARNAGIARATGGIVAFLDADAACHPEWPYHLALSLEDSQLAAVGGPNLPVPDAGLVERAVALSPGSPTHVLLSDDRAEHVPGCNIAIRKSVLAQIGGFDPSFTAAGDDVDVCWKILDRGEGIGFSPAAQVRHRRRARVRAYLRQQRGYGRAEKALASRHPHRFNRLGQARWAGFIYGGPRLLYSFLRPVVYHGSYGLAPFQGVVRRRSEILLTWCQAFLPLVGPALICALVLAGLTTSIVPYAAAGAAIIAAYTTAVAVAVRVAPGEPTPVRLRALVAALHLAQPYARAWGRLRGSPPAAALPDAAPQWNGDRATWLDHLRRDLSGRGASVRPAATHDQWDLEISVGPLITCRLTTAVAWQWTPLNRIRLRPRSLAYLLATVSALLVTAGYRAGLVGLGLAVFGAAAEALFVMRLVRRSIRSTTRGAT